MALYSILEIYKPFFSTKRADAWQWMLAGLLLLGNICQAGMIVVINTCFNSFFGIINLPGFTYYALFYAMGQFALSVFIYATTAAINSLVGDQLINHLNELVTNHFVTKWLKSKTYFGANLLSNKKVSNPSILFSHDIQDANKLAVKLGDNFIHTFFAFVVGIYGLWQLSAPLTFQIASIAFVVPGYMAMGALLYALINNLVVNKIGHKFYEVTEKQNNNISKLAGQLHHIEKNAEGIELLQAQNREKSNALKILKEGKIYQGIMAKLQSGLAFCTALNEELRFFTGLLLSLPQIISKTISIDNLLIISDNFSRVVGFPAWRQDNHEDWVRLSVLTGKLHELNKDIHAWEKIQNKNNLSLSRGTHLSLQNLIIRKPDATLVMKQKQFTFENKKITLIQGPSGVGKSTLFRVLSGLWPYVDGTITLPVSLDRMHIAPQKTYFPMHSSLYEGVLYPCDKNINLVKKREIDGLLKKFTFSESVLNKAHEKRDWAKVLSGGEQQRIAIIRAILAKPELLLMDEPYSALDPALQAHCEKQLKNYLPETTIIYIDHHSVKPKKQKILKPLYDYQVTLKNQALSVTHQTKKTPRGMRARSF